MLVRYGEGFVVKWAIISRLVMWILSVVVNFSIRDYDTSCTVTQLSGADSILESVFGQLARWDGVYFTRIAQHGYEYEQNHAFFPLLPILMNLIAKAISLTSVATLLSLSDRSVILISGFLLTNLCFVYASIYLHRLSRVVLKDDKLALISCLLFCISPASIFLSAIYTESLFALVSFAGMYHLAIDNNFLASFWFALACATRGNGILYCGFFIFNASTSFSPFSPGNRMWSWRNFLVKWISTAIYCLITITPFLLFQYYGYTRYCLDPSRHNLSPWCTNQFPNLYNYVQSHYWNQGFFNYWQVKQIPNFLLASPIILLSIFGIYSYVSNYLEHTQLLQTSTGGWRLTIPKLQGFYSGQVFVYVAYWLFLVVFGVTFMHVQVVTRFYSACPPLYWYSASLFELKSSLNYNWKPKLLLFYFLLYCLLGLVLFCNFYPWT